ncbi:MAG: GNAT family N-acetyltransferase [candidate division Zixibacteria bacterium]|nr:GNAT family N-acetyltransferase [candidate division Zixibacteria bacterium]
MENEITKQEPSWLKRARQIYWQRGVLALFWAGVVKILKSAFDTNSAIWFERDLSQPIEESQARIPLTFVRDSPQKTLAWLRSFGHPGLVHPKEIETGIKEKHYFFHVRRDGGEIVGAQKVGYGKVYIVDFGKTVHFSQGTAFSYDAYVPPKLRGLGIATYLITQSLLFLKERGYKKVLGHIPRWNQASIKAVKRCGFTVIGYVRFFKVFGFKFTLPNLDKVIRS